MAAAAKKRRIDPEPESIDPDEDLGQVLNKDPNLDYVWAYKVGGAIGMYENRGYDVVLSSVDGARSMTQRKQRALDVPVEWNDNVLMSRPKTLSDEAYARSQRKADKMEASIISQDGPADPSRGIQRFQRGRTAVGLVNSTSEAVPDESV